MTSKFNKLLLAKRNNYKVLTDDDFTTETEILNLAAQVLNSGVDIIELHFVAKSSGIILQIARKLRELSSYFDALFAIYDRVDIAKLVSADAVVIDNSSISYDDAKKLLEDTMLIGYNALKHDTINALELDKYDFLVTQSSIKFDFRGKIFVVA